MKTMKKLLVCALALVLTGCMKMRVTFDVTKEGEVTGSYRILVSTAFAESMGANIDDMVKEFQDSLKEQYPEGNAKLVNEKYDDVNYAGVEVTDIKNTEAKAEADNGKITLVIPMSSVEEDISDTIGVDDSTIDVASLKESGLEITMVVNMPGKAESNVGTVKGNTVTIDLLEMPKDVTEIRITSGTGSNNTLIYIGGGAVVVLGAVFAFLKLRK